MSRISRHEEPSQVEEPDFNYGGEYSYADYLRWTIETRLELIRGKIFEMSAPNRVHQTVSGRLFLSLGNYLQKHKCQLFAAPFDVRFPRKSKRDEDVTTVLQPDLCVICDETQLDDRGAIGAPDIVVEILSKSNNRKELRNKFEIYEESGVKEYWVVSPTNSTVAIHVLQEAGTFGIPTVFAGTEVAVSTVLPGFSIRMDELFERK